MNNLFCGFQLMKATRRAKTPIRRHKRKTAKRHRRKTSCGGTAMLTVMHSYKQLVENFFVKIGEVFDVAHKPTGIMLYFKLKHDYCILFDLDESSFYYYKDNEELNETTIKKSFFLSLRFLIDLYTDEFAYHFEKKKTYIDDA